MSYVEEQIADIRERVASVEAQLAGIQKTLNDMTSKAGNGGHVVVPVAVVVSLVEIAKVLIERMV